MDGRDWDRDRSMSMPLDIEQRVLMGTVLALAFLWAWIHEGY